MVRTINLAVFGAFSVRRSLCARITSLLDLDGTDRFGVDMISFRCAIFINTEY